MFDLIVEKSEKILSQSFLQSDGSSWKMEELFLLIGPFVGTIGGLNSPSSSNANKM